MKIAVLILAHKNIEQLSRLTDCLQHADVDIFVHVDKKYKITPPLLNFINKNVFLLKEQISCYLNQYSLVDATLKLMVEASKHDKYKYYILLSGQDYPIKKMDFIVNFLQKSYPREFLDFAVVKKSAWCENWGKRCFNQPFRAALYDIIGPKRYFSKTGYYLRAPIKIIVDNIQTWFCGKPIDDLRKLGFTYSAGSAFWMLTDQSVNHIIKTMQSGKKMALQKIFKRTQTPEECFFQTILSDTQYVNNIMDIENKIEYADPLISRMDREKLLRFIFDYKDGVSSGHPYNLSVNEYDMLICSNSLFARKFDMNYDKEILDKLDLYFKNE